MAKNYFERYIWLINTVSRHGHIPFKRISELWEESSLNDRPGEQLSNRTFFNHLEAISDTFGIEIKCDRSLGYYIANSDDLESDGIRRWLLESLSMSNLLNESRDMRDRILFEKIPSSQRWLSVIMNAMRDGKAVEMTYKSFWSEEAHSFKAHLYCLKIFKQRWYVLAYSEERKQNRIYALDRILDIKVLDAPLKLPKGFNAAEFFRNFYGVFLESRKAETVELKVDSGQVNYFDSLPLHDSQTKVEETAEYTVYRYHLVPTYDFEQEILSRGCEVEVLSPKWFRDDVAADIRAMMKRYD
jgi:hypothetical protein